MIRQRNQDGDTFDWQNYDEPVARFGQGSYERRIYPRDLTPAQRDKSILRTLAMLIPLMVASAIAGAGVAVVLMS